MKYSPSAAFAGTPRARSPGRRPARTTSAPRSRTALDANRVMQRPQVVSVRPRQGCGVAMANLGFLYLYGFGVKAGQSRSAARGSSAPRPGARSKRILKPSRAMTATRCKGAPVAPLHPVRCSNQKRTYLAVHEPAARIVLARDVPVQVRVTVADRERRFLVERVVEPERDRDALEPRVAAPAGSA